MDKNFTARLDKSILREMGRVPRRPGLTKKKFLEQAIHSRVEELQTTYGSDVWEETRGAWKRKESPEKIREKVRMVFEASMNRHHSKR